MSGELGKSRKSFAVSTLRSGFGSQPTSTKNSNPAYGFGSSVREHAAKQYLSPDHAKVMPGNNSQGPIYKLGSSLGTQYESKMESGALYSFGTEPRLPRGNLSSAPGPGAYRQLPGSGKQVASTKKSSESVIFGTSTRDQVAKVYMEDADKAFYGLESPGPGAYHTSGAVGKQQLSTKESAATFKMGTSSRFNYDFVRRAKECPGAGQYVIKGSVGKQEVSTKKTLPAYRFGSSTRDAVKKIFISPEHEKATYGENSPGPVTASMRSSMGGQHLSAKKSNPSWGFGTSKRNTITVTENPGPGSYFA